MLRSCQDLLPWACLLLQLHGCGVPVDPQQTTMHVHAKGMSVGYSRNAPWTSSPQSASPAIEMQLLTDFAKEQELKILWREASESELFDALDRGEIDVVIAGFTSDSLWTERAAKTLPYASDADGEHVMFVRQGENRWLLELDRYLQSRRDELQTLVTKRRPDERRHALN